MDYDTLILTKNGFTFLKDLVPKKDYLVTKSGKLTKFIGFDDIINSQYKVTFSTGETIILSEDDIIDLTKLNGSNYEDVFTIYQSKDTPTIKDISYLNFKSKSKVGYSHIDCYDIGYKRNFEKLKDINFTNFSINQKKEFIAGLIDNGMSVIKENIIINDLDYDIIKIIIHIIRSLGYNCNIKNENSLYFKPNNNIGLLPIKSIEKAQKVLCIMQTSDLIKTSIVSIKETTMKPGYSLIVNINEPILIGYSLIPIYQSKR